MEVVIINKPAMRLIGLATNVTLYDWSESEESVTDICFPVRKK
jgi:hypothetical protein